MSERWIHRKGTKTRGFRYVTSEGKPVREKSALERIDALRIPPAWKDVHIAPSARQAIQAWGFDVKGRKQYRYHERAVAKGQLRKYYRVRQLARDLPRIRTALARDFRRREPTRDKIAAGVVRLIADGFFRVGSERYVSENGSFGITTLRKSHVSLEDACAVFEYTGKRQVEQRQVIADPALVRFVRQLLKSPGRRLFQYRDADGKWRSLNSRDVNDYLKELTGFPYTAKDFRTWGGTLRMATVLAELGPAHSDREAKKNVLTAVRFVAAELGNTPAICRKSYIHPVVIARYEKQGDTIARRLAAGSAARASNAHSPEEKALIGFLDRHFPERRRQTRIADRESRKDRESRSE